MQLLSICYQKTFKSAANRHKYWILKAFQIIQTPLRTAFHDTQRLLLEAYISNVCSNFVFFAPLMKK